MIKKLGHSCFMAMADSFHLLGRVNVIELKLELTHNEATSIAQFLKRTGFKDYLDNASSDDEAYRMMWAMDKIRIALAEQDIKPR